MRKSACYAKNQEILAAALSVDRSTIRNIIRKYPNLLPGVKRGAELNGDYDIKAWRKLLDQLGIHGKGPNNPNYADERDLRLREWKLRLDLREFELAKARDERLRVS